MSDLVKAQNTPQFNWYTRWTSLGANGMPYKLIDEGLKQKISSKKNSKVSNSKEITSHVVPDQAQFGTEYFLAYTLPNFKSKILTRLLDAQKDDGPLLFSLMGRCFQDVGLTKWTSVIAKQCPNDADRTKANFDNQHHCEAMSSQCRLYKGKLRRVYQGLPWGLHRISKYRQPADLLAPYFQEALSHADARVHAASSTASQLPWRWLPLLNNGCTYGAREEWINFLRAA